MRTVGQFVTHASTQLNDQRPGRAFTRWGRGLLLDYLNLGLSEISTYRPEAFARDLQLTLVPGASQIVPNGYSLLAITSNLDGSPITKGDYGMAAAFNAYAPCVANGMRFVDGTPTFAVRTHSIDPNDARKFYVDPPVPKGLEVKVNASVHASADVYTLADWDKDILIDDKYKFNLIDFILACAYGLDQESPQSRRRSDDLYSRFYNVLGVKYRQEAKFRSGYYLGKVGSGDPQAGNR